MNILILGGGYAGQMAVNRLRQRVPDAHLTVVDGRPHFVERTRLHEVAAGSEPARVPFSQLFPSPVRFVCGRVTAVQPGSVSLEDGRSLAWQYLVFALGSHIGGDAVPGVVQHAVRLNDLDDARALRGGEGEVWVIGSGATGIEVAAELAEVGRNVTLYSGSPVGADLREGAARSLRDHLERLGVRLRTGPRVIEVTAEGVVTEERVWKAAKVVWCAGFRASPLAAQLGFECDGQDRVLVADDLQIPGLAGAVACGDVAALPGRPWIRMGCVTAMPMGAHAGDTVADLVLGLPPAPFRFGFAIRCTSLGRRDAMIQAVDAYDTPSRMFLMGRPASWIKEGILRMTTALPSAERTTGRALYTWPKPSLESS